MNKNFLWSVLILFLIAAIAVLFYKTGLYSKVFTSSKSDTHQELPLPSEPVKEFSIGAKVSSVSNNTLGISVSRTVVGSNGNYIIDENKTANISSTTKIYFTKISQGKFTKTLTDVNNLKVGDSVTLYSIDNIARMDSFTPTKIYINQK